MKAKIYDRIKGQVVHGRWRSGEKLAELKLAAEFRSPRGPVRSALHRLASEGLLERESNRGCRVARVDAETLIGLYELREGIEGMAARLAARRINDIQLSALEHEEEQLEALKGDDLDRVLASNERFHRGLVSAGGNRFLLEAWEGYYLRQVFVHNSMRVSDRVYRHNRELAFDAHHRILKALRTHDADAAEAAARRHIVESRVFFARLLAQEKSGARPAPLRRAAR